MIPRPQPADRFCTLHNFNVIPLLNQDRYVGVSASYEGGTTVFDFSRVAALPPRNIEDLLPSQIKQPIPLAGAEIAFSDTQGEDRRMRDDTWSSYWYNDHIWVSGGLGGIRPELASNRGFDVYLLLDQKGQQFRARRFQHLNPQTQEVFQTLGSGRGD